MPFWVPLARLSSLHGLLPLRTMPLDHAQTGRDVEVLAPTWLEYWAVRSLRPPATVSRSGVALRAWRGPHASSLIVCGLAGALSPHLPPGAVLVPESAGRPDGAVLRCDPELRQALLAGARSLGVDPDPRPLLTAPSVVTGAARREWTKQGFAAADMETGLLAGKNLRVATVRVVLDTPQRSISEQWTDPGRALLQPALWAELIWLARAAPFCALLAARILRAGLERLAPAGAPA